MRAFIAVLTGALLSVSVACGGDDDEDNGTGGTGGGSAACEQGCTDTIAADCPMGPPDQATCVSQCRALSSGACKAEYAEFQACAEGKTITCGSNGIPVVEECSAEQAAFIACLT
jgi:hypothetical protein